MLEKIKEVYQYFRIQILNGTFTIEGCDEHYVTIKVDGYPFKFWVVNGTRWIETKEESFMQLEFDELEREIINGFLQPFFRQYQIDVVLEEKIKELEKLKLKYKEV